MRYHLPQLPLPALEPFGLKVIEELLGKLEERMQRSDPKAIEVVVRHMKPMIFRAQDLHTASLRRSCLKQMTGTGQDDLYAGDHLKHCRARLQPTECPVTGTIALHWFENWQTSSAKARIVEQSLDHQIEETVSFAVGRHESER